MAAHDNLSSRLRRWTLFSLRSLLLFVALCSAGTGLWHRWEPWWSVEVLEGHSEAVVSAANHPRMAVM